MVIDKMIEGLKYCSNLAFHLLKDVRDNFIGPIYHQTNEKVPILHTMIWNPSLNLKFFEKVEANDLIRVEREERA